MKSCQNEYVIIIHKSIDYIENNLKTKLNLDDLARQAGFSKFHYDRLFTAMVGLSPIDYVRKRKLSLAASELTMTDKSSADIGIDFGFSSPEAFSRAFKKIFGKTPGEYRVMPEKNTLFDKVDIVKKFTRNYLSLGLSEPRIISKEKFNIIGMEYLVDFDDDNKELCIQQLWKLFLREKHKLMSYAVDDITRGICMNTVHPGKFSYTACIEVNKQVDVPLGMSMKTIPRMDYAVFLHKGNLDKLTETYSNIYGLWLPFSEYQLCTEIADMEVYDQRFTMDEDSEIEIHLPVKLKR